MVVLTTPLLFMVETPIVVISFKCNIGSYNIQKHIINLIFLQTCGYNNVHLTFCKCAIFLNVKLNW